MYRGRLISKYRSLHQRHMFPGLSITPFLPEIINLVSVSKAKRILDYGCGEGMQYIQERFYEAWGTKIPTMYDPAVPGLDQPPSGTFDGVICTDVLEHVPEDELDNVINDLVNYSRMWAFVSVCCRPAKRKFDDGTNVHVTIKPFTWWQEKLGERFAKDKRNLVLRETP